MSTKWQVVNVNEFLNLIWCCSNTIYYLDLGLFIFARRAKKKKWNYNFISILKVNEYTRSLMLHRKENTKKKNVDGTFPFSLYFLLRFFFYSFNLIRKNSTWCAGARDKCCSKWKFISKTFSFDYLFTAHTHYFSIQSTAIFQFLDSFSHFFFHLCIVRSSPFS